MTRSRGKSRPPLPCSRSKQSQYKTVLQIRVPLLNVLDSLTRVMLSSSAKWFRLPGCWWSSPPARPLHAAGKVPEYFRAEHSEASPSFLAGLISIIDRAVGSVSRSDRSGEIWFRSEMLVFAFAVLLISVTERGLFCRPSASPISQLHKVNDVVDVLPLWAKRRNNCRHSLPTALFLLLGTAEIRRQMILLAPR